LLFIKFHLLLFSLGAVDVLGFFEASRLIKGIL
jgi:hypothetical protein